MVCVCAASAPRAVRLAAIWTGCVLLPSFLEIPHAAQAAIAPAAGSDHLRWHRRTATTATDQGAKTAGAIASGCLRERAWADVP